MTGAAIAGAGLVGLGVGGVIGLAALSQYHVAEAETGGAAKRDSDSAVSTGDIGTIVAAIGGGAAAVGLVLWLTAPSASTHVGTDGRSVYVSGRF
jgi:hypothetical protein